jgi:hypothetical protein
MGGDQARQRGRGARSNDCRSRIALAHDPDEACPGLDPGSIPVSRLHEVDRFSFRLMLQRAKAGRKRLEKFIHK